MTFLTRFERWDPFDELTALRGRMDSLWSRMTTQEEPVLADWAPTSDVLETAGEILIRAELPGVDEKDVDIQLEGGVLTIRGERKAEKEAEEKGYRRIERAYGSFLRSYPLPQNVEAEKIAATLTNGLLEVHLPKKEGALPRRIELAKGLAKGTAPKPEPKLTEPKATEPKGTETKKVEERELATV